MSYLFYYLVLMSFWDISENLWKVLYGTIESKPVTIFS